MPPSGKGPAPSGERPEHAPSRADAKAALLASAPGFPNRPRRVSAVPARAPVVFPAASPGFVPRLCPPACPWPISPPSAAAPAASAPSGCSGFPGFSGFPAAAPRRPLSGRCPRLPGSRPASRPSRRSHPSADHSRAPESGGSPWSGRGSPRPPLGAEPSACPARPLWDLFGHAHSDVGQSRPVASRSARSPGVPPRGTCRAGPPRARPVPVDGGPLAVVHLLARCAASLFDGRSRCPNHRFAAPHAPQGSCPGTGPGVGEPGRHTRTAVDGPPGAGTPRACPRPRTGLRRRPAAPARWAAPGPAGRGSRWRSPPGESASSRAPCPPWAAGRW